MPIHSELSSDSESIHSEEEMTTQTTDMVTEPKEQTKKIGFSEFVKNHITEFEQFKETLNDSNMKDFMKTFNKFMKSEEQFIHKLEKMHLKDRKTKSPKEY